MTSAATTTAMKPSASSVESFPTTMEPTAFVTAMKAFATMEPFATTEPSCMVGAAMSEGIPTMIGTMVEVGIVMVATTPVMEVVIEMLVEVPIVGKWSPANIEGRIKTPTERAIKDSISWDVGIAVVIRIPIPSGAIPVTRRVDVCPIHVGFRGIR